jgi:uncharacterized membrane protein
MSITKSRARTIALAITYAALYSALSLLLAPFSFGPVQVRIAGMLLGAVPFLGLAGVFGQTIGCLIVNSVSPLGLIDLVNVIPTFVMVLIIWKLKGRNVVIGLSAYCLVTSLSIAFALNFAFGLPIVVTYFTVLVGQVIACVIGGVIVNKSLGKILHSNSV